MAATRFVRAALLAIACAIPSTTLAQTTPVPPVTEEDRKAAFPEGLEGHAVHDTGVHYFVLLDQIEAQVTGDGAGALWDAKAWVGGDINRIWLRTEADYDGDQFESAEGHLLLGRNISRWWTLVGGFRQDFAPGVGRTWAAVGLQGLAPQWFEVEATAYLGESARTAFRIEAEYDLLFTDKLVMQPLAEMNLFGKDDPERGIGAGLSTIEFGARLRYEVRREVAPYAGLVWHRKVFGTGDYAREAGDSVGGWRFVTGVRLWF